MNWIKRNKEILLQILVFTGIALYFHKTWMLYIAAILVLISPFQIISSNYILYLNLTINYVGFLLKSILFAMLFALVIIPISLILKVKKDEKPADFINVNNTKEPSSFLKMW